MSFQGKDVLGWKVKCFLCVFDCECACVTHTQTNYIYIYI